MAGSLISFSLLAIGARELSGEISIFQSLFSRSVIGVLYISMVLFFLNKKTGIRTTKIKLHIFRNVFHFVGQYAWFLGIGLLPLAEVFALEFTAPIWTLIIAAMFLGEKVTRYKLAAVILGLLGVLVITKPGIDVMDSASFIVLGAAVCFAITLTTTKSLSTSEPPVLILFYMSLIQLPISFIFALVSWTWPTMQQWIWLLIISFTALSAHYCMAKAMQYAEVTMVVTVDFLRLPLIALVGVFLYAEEFEISLLLGGFLMLLGNLINVSKLAKKEK
ncbi:MAG: EamA family transporter [SAR86 cluster bacterium]|uniref:EamA family transporter n=1 Tax=SAR86 cluster bacterium TaxID=2030880 RepID=A0A2A5CBQ3_9GAMM|nr:MAG: EamA family transporter [SAR86 cluster bacterium]